MLSTLLKAAYVAADLHRCWLIAPESHRAFKHPIGSMISSLGRLRSGLMSFLALLKIPLHSAEVTGIVRKRVGYMRRKA